MMYQSSTRTSGIGGYSALRTYKKLNTRSAAIVDAECADLDSDQVDTLHNAQGYGPHVQPEYVRLSTGMLGGEEKEREQHRDKQRREHSGKQRHSHRVLHIGSVDEARRRDWQEVNGRHRCSDEVGKDQRAMHIANAIGIEQSQLICRQGTESIQLLGAM